jgi:hypothetical protein
MVYIRPIMSIRTPQDLDKNFQFCVELAVRFVGDPRSEKGRKRMQAVDVQVAGSGFQWAKADVFFADEADPPTGHYHFLAPAWAEHGGNLACRSIVHKGPQSHKYTTPP